MNEPMSWLPSGRNDDIAPASRSAQSLGRNALPSLVIPWMKNSRGLGADMQRDVAARAARDCAAFVLQSRLQRRSEDRPLESRRPKCAVDTRFSDPKLAEPRHERAGKNRTIRGTPRD